MVFRASIGRRCGEPPRGRWVVAGDMERCRRCHATRHGVVASCRRMQTNAKNSSKASKLQSFNARLGFDASSESIRTSSSSLFTRTFPYQYQYRHPRSEYRKPESKSNESVSDVLATGLAVTLVGLVLFLNSQVPLYLECIVFSMLTWSVLA